MCGIAGWIDRSADLTREGGTLEAMAAVMACRGPDAQGGWLSRTAGVAHRRLTVIDPAGGGQPMVRRRGGQTYVLVYNGELYNTEEIRRDLAGRGWTFEGHSDTEVVLAAYMQWGPACVERFNGIYAFGVWEESDKQLFLARDRMGVKPLFFARRGGALLFASELKALLVHPLVEPRVDSEGLQEVFGLGPARTPGHGVFAGVEELKAGHALIHTPRSTRVYPYWRLESHPHPDDPDRTASVVRGLFLDAVERQLVSDVPLCTLLSGGLDSSAISAVAARCYREQGMPPLHTWSIDYLDNQKHFRAHDFQPNSDAAFIPLMAGALHSDHHEVVIDTPELVEALVPAVLARDLPGMADVDSSLLLFCRRIREEATVALSGECADEVFGGYPWFHRPDALAADTFPWSLQPDLRSSVLAPEVAADLRIGEYISRRYREALEEVPGLPGESPEAARLREVSYLTLTRFMPVLLDRKDRMSMACSLEVRVPFCDHRLVEYVWNIPWPLKNSGHTAKGILRRALAGLLPDEVLHRRKSPYPKTHNPNYLRAVSQALLQLLEDPSSHIRPLLNVDFLRTAAASADAASQFPWFGQLMSGPQLFAYLLQVEVWLREYKVRIV